MDLLEPLRTQPAAFVALAGMLGLLVGSFLNVVVYRLPRMMEREWRAQCAELAGEDAIPGHHPGETATAPATTGRFNLAFPASHCPACNAPIRLWQNIPVLSWLLLRGRCAACSARIGLRYPLIELATGAASAVVAWRLGFGAAACAGLLATSYLPILLIGC